MIRFLRVSIQNFMSYGNIPTVVDLDTSGTTLILGEDLDNTSSGLGNNGVGKTTLLNALVYGLYDKPISKINLDNLINHVNKKNMVVEVWFEKNGTEYHIRRTRKVKSGVEARTIEFYINGEEDKTLDSVDNTNKKIVEILGMPYDLFVRIVAYSATLTPFLDLPSRHASQTNQTDIIEELFDLKTVSEKAEVLKKKISDSEKQIELKVSHLEQLKKEHERHGKQIESVKVRSRDWEVQNARDIEINTKQLTVLQAIDVEHERKLIDQIAAIEDQIKEKSSALRELTTKLESKKAVLKAELSKHSAVLLTKESELKALKTEMATLVRETASIQQSIDQLDTEKSKLSNHKCPYCSQEFKDVKAKIKHVTSEKTKKESRLAEIDDLVLSVSEKKEAKDSEITEVKSMVATIKKQLQDIQKANDAELDVSSAEIVELQTSIIEIQKQQQVTTLDSLHELHRKIDVIQQKITNASTLVNPHTQTLQELEAQELEVVDMTQVNDLKSLVDHQKFLLKLLTKKDSFVRKALLNKSIPFLNQRLACYLSELGLPHKVEFTHEMAASITQFERPMDFGNLSNGQRARVNIALSFAFRDVLQSLHQKINVCMLDEVLDVGLDTLGVQAAARMLKRKAREEGLSLFIISHRDEVDSAFDRKMLVQMSKGFSYVTFKE